MLITALTMGAVLEPDGDFLHERFVDLQRVDGKVLQVTQAGPPGSKVVDGQMDSQVFERMKHGVRCIDMRHEHAFGQLDFEIARVQPRLLQDVDDIVQEGSCPKLDGGNVDGDRNRPEAGILPRLRLPAGFANDPAANRLDQPAVFGDRRRTGPARPVPAPDAASGSAPRRRQWRRFSD